MSDNEPRDPRAINHMDPETKVAHARLESWGRATRGGIENGYPSNTILGRMIEQGPMGASQGGRPPTALSEADARVDVCVGKLWGIGQRCVKRYYQGPPDAVEIMARREGIRVRQFQNVLRRSRFLIAMWLISMESERNV